MAQKEGSLGNIWVPVLIVFIFALIGVLFGHYSKSGPFSFFYALLAFAFAPIGVGVALMVQYATTKTRRN